MYKCIVLGISIGIPILWYIFSGDDNPENERDHKTFQRNPSADSTSYDTSVRRSSSYSHNDDHLLRQSYPSKTYQNISTRNSTTKDANSASFQSNYEKSLGEAGNVSQSFSSSSKLSQSSAKQAPSPSSDLSQSYSQPPPSSLQSKYENKSLGRTSDVSQSLGSASTLPKSSAKQAPPSSLDYSTHYYFGTLPSCAKAPLSSKPTLSALPSDSTSKQVKAYTLVQKGTEPIYMIPKDIEDLIDKDIVPNVLMKPLSRSTYKDYFAALLYAEDFYVEKWSEYKLFDVILELHEAEIHNKSSKNKNKESDGKNDKIFVEFEIDSVPERRPFLLSRDFVLARPLDNKTKEFKGIIYRVIKSNIVLVEFEKEFNSQHHSTQRYDVSFSFNRVCLKRAHQAIAAVSGPIFDNYLFPDFICRKKISAPITTFYCNYKLDLDQSSAVHQILSFQGSPPYLVEGPLSVNCNELSRTGMVVKDAVFQLYTASPKTRILICAPLNKTCDVLMASLKKSIRESDMFRANAAFREIDGVPVDILPLCLYERQCFTCPSLEKLKQFRVIFSTYVSSYRLHNEGITAEHFTHIFLVDASSATEPETLIPLSNLTNQDTSVIVTGSRRNYSSWVRSDIGRKKGLRTSYFERLLENKTYKSLEPRFITRL